MLLSPNFDNVSVNCQLPLSLDTTCRKCVNSGILFLRRLNGVNDNITLSMCRNAAFVALVNKEDSAGIVDLASCFFSVQGLFIPPSVSVSSPNASPLHDPFVIEERRHRYRLKLIPIIFIGIMGSAAILLVVMLLLIRRKNRELNGSKETLTLLKISEGPRLMFRRFSFKETKKATRNFTSKIGTSGTVYKGEFSSGEVVAVKRADRFLEREESEFCRETELLGRLHHRHLVSLKGFCARGHER